MIHYQGDGFKPLEKPVNFISLVPSQTELLYYLGVPPIAQTLFCVHPKNRFKSSTKIGGTKKINLAKILALKPDLVIGNKEENDQTQIEELATHFPVWLSDIYTLADAFEMINEIGKLVGKEAKANELATTLQQEFYRPYGNNTIKSCLYLIWREPYMAAGQNTFINAILQALGYSNVMPKNSRYPEINKEQLLELNPETILLSSEPYPFRQKHISELQAILPNAKIKLVDGELFSWYGPRLLETAKLLNRIT